jgi:hypothetical protein
MVFIPTIQPHIQAKKLLFKKEPQNVSVGPITVIYTSKQAIYIDDLELQYRPIISLACILFLLLNYVAKFRQQATLFCKLVFAMSQTLRLLCRVGPRCESLADVFSIHTPATGPNGFH